jgi:hypothetical protein
VDDIIRLGLSNDVFSVSDRIVSKVFGIEIANVSVDTEKKGFVKSDVCFHTMPPAVKVVTNYTWDPNGSIMF